MEMKDIIKRQREILNLTLEEIGNYVGVGKSTVKKWESGNIKNMRRDKIQKLAEILQLSPAYLMGWENKGYGSKLKNLREKNKLSIEDLANKISLPLEDLIKIENNEYVKLSDDNLSNLSKALNISEDEMIKIFMDDLAYRTTTPNVLDPKLANYIIDVYEQISKKPTADKQESDNNCGEHMSISELTFEEKELITKWRKLKRDDQLKIIGAVDIKYEECAAIDDTVKSA